MVGVLFAYSGHSVPLIETHFDHGKQPPDLRKQASGEGLGESSVGEQAGRRQRLSSKVEREILTRYAAGETATGIASGLGVAKSSVLKTVEKASVHRPRRVLSEEEVARARELRDQGLLFREIAERLGVSKETIRKRLLD